MSKPTFLEEDIAKWKTPHLFDQPKSEVETEPEQTAEEIKQLAYEEGRKKGYQDGLKQGLNDIRQRVTVVEKFINALYQPFNEQNNLLAEALAHLAGKIAKSVVRRELRTDPEIIMALVRDAITQLNTTVHKINIHLNPKDAAIIRQIIKDDSHEEKWLLFDDPGIARGDCKITSENSLIDSDLQTRINLIIIQFLGDERKENRDDS